MSMAKCLFLQMALFTSCFECQQTTSDRCNGGKDESKFIEILQSLEKLHQRLERIEHQNRSATMQQKTLGRDNCEDFRSKIANIHQSLEKIQQHRNRSVTTALRTKCPPGFNFSARAVSKCYAVVTQPLSWDAAQAHCRQLHQNSHLIVINSALENQIISEILEKYECRGASNKGPNNITYSVNNFWTSGQRSNASCKHTFLWRPTSGFNQELNYKSWCGGEPNCAFNQEHCLSLAKNCNHRNIIGWNDNICTWRQCSMCEILWLDGQEHNQLPKFVEEEEEYDLRSLFDFDIEV